MPRGERKASKTGIYHVMLRGISQQRIFEDREDYAWFLECISEVKKLSEFKLFAYCLMGNHVHLLLKEGKEPLAQIFRRIGARYVFWFNWKYRRNGHLFQDRFRSEPIETDEYFLSVLVYIYQNPVAAGLCKSPRDYEWCSRRMLGKCEVIDEEELRKIVPLDEVKKREREETKCDLLEPKIGRRMALSDEDAFKQMKTLSGVKTTTEFQALDQQRQSRVFCEMRKKGASIRQLARLAGLGKGVVERLCRASRDA